MDSERKQRFIGVLERRIASRSTMSASWYIWTVLRPIYHLNSKVYDKVDASAVAYANHSVLRSISVISQHSD